jgi:translation elongation factor EF-Tu-like GTPase
VYVLKKEEGAVTRRFFSGYKPQFYSDDGRDGGIALPEGVENGHA